MHEILQRAAARKEVISSDTMVTVAKRLLQKYRDINRRYPEFVVVMRDGIGESQVAEMIAQEVHGIKKVGRGCWRSALSFRTH